MDPTLENPSTSDLSLPSSEQHPSLSSQYSNVPDNHILEELFQKIQYFNKRALNYYILIDLFNPDTVESNTKEVLNEVASDDSGLDSSFVST